MDNPQRIKLGNSELFVTNTGLKEKHLNQHY
jgi:hypothetical protein